MKHKRTNKQQWLITELRLSASDEFIKSYPPKRQICCSTAVISESRAAVRACLRSRLRQRLFVLTVPMFRSAPMVCHRAADYRPGMHATAFFVERCFE